MCQTLYPIMKGALHILSLDITNKGLNAHLRFTSTALTGSKVLWGGIFVFELARSALAKLAQPVDLDKLNP